MSDIRVQAGIKLKHNQATSIVARMSLAEKATFCSGMNFWHLEASEHLGLPSVMLTDGPHGLRKQVGTGDHIGLNTSVPATCFPPACSLASSWDTDLLNEVGVALGEQCVAENVAVLLGPGINIKRHPLCGRNFEYFSEDPLLSGELAAAMIRGVQSQGVGTSLKHYAVNNQENDRMLIDAIVDERTLREIYLRGFEIAVRKAQPWTVMCAYNRLNGTYCSENDWLLNQVLRDEWGFEGLVVTDWGAANNRVRGLRAGLDLEMPSSGGINDRRIVAAVKEGSLSESVLDRTVARNISLNLLGAELSDRKATFDHSAHHELAKKVAIESMVLLKNDDNLLPLQSTASIAVIGAFAQQPRYQGAGSSQVTPTQLDCSFDALQLMLGGSPPYAPGYDPVHSKPDNELVEQAATVAASAEVAILFAGLPAIYESEGFDRTHMRLPEQHDRLIQEVCAANPNTVVVLSNGAPVEMPWVEAPGAILETNLGGQAGGSAVVDVLFGVASPAGKLAETMPLCQADVPADRWFPGTGRQVKYREGLYLGYRYFDSARKPVLYPFGHGLSYTQFEYANLTLSRLNIKPGDELLVSLNLTNIGDRMGSEIVQLYVNDLESSVYRPEQELRAFTKITLDPGESGEVSFRLDGKAFAIYDPGIHDWLVEAGEFEIRVGASSRDIRLSQRLHVESLQSISKSQCAGLRPEIAEHGLVVPDPVYASMLGKPLPPSESSRPYHLNSSLNEIAETWLGRNVRSKVIASMQQSIGGGNNDKTTQKMVEEIVNNMPLRSLAMLGGGDLSFKSLSVLVALLNKRWFTAMRLMTRAESAVDW